MITTKRTIMPNVLIRKEITDNELKEIAKNSGIHYAMLKAFIEVESSGHGFDNKTGKLIIQFEPSWFRKKEPYAPSGQWSINKVDVQSKEWIAFNNAFAIDPDSAMESTSIGLPQIMGFHWKRLGYKFVGEMWDSFKRGEYFQILALIRFIKTDPALYRAIRERDFYRVAYIYNGSKFKAMAKKGGREPYDISMQKSFDKWRAKNV